ncbi:hypothetical protein [Streptomyces sp. CBMA156]|uniref:hypothetical protein n=1 Tax=Streptomyces sp. CBMA156 TaxID=1930280 RepID=UPI001CB7D535|nr:hypothetical protein [Streptomyces sp. CBMA156]
MARPAAAGSHGRTVGPSFETVYQVPPGDVEIRFRPLGPLDRGGLPVVIEIRSTWFAARAADRQERVDALHAGIRAATGLVDFGVHVSLPVAAWSRGE